MTGLLDAALDLAAHGFAVIPVAADGTKRPGVDWKRWQHERPDEAQLRAWFGGSAYDGLGCVTGSTSGGLELFEVEGRAAHLAGDLGRIMADHDLADLWQRLCTGWLEVSPSGGMHWLYRVLDDQGAPAARPNTKLARRRSPDNPRVVDVLIETRGEGGFTVTAPSAGRSHPTGRAWAIIAGGPATCPTITVEERDALYALAAMLDEMPTISAPTFSGGVPLRDTAGELHGERPGDDYNVKATWADILEPAGWTRARKLGDGYGWTRPGKDARLGISATTGTAADGVDRLYVFTTSTEFEAETPYSKFGAYALLHHNGDHAEAARALRKAGYGAPLPERKLTIVPAGGEPDPRRAQPMVESGEPPAGAQTGPSPHEPAQNSAVSASGAVDGATVHQLSPRPAAATLADSEDAHAHRLIASYGDRIRYVPARKSWLVWSGARWVWQDDGGLVREYAKDVARRLTEAEVPHAQRRKALSASGIDGCLKQARTDPRVVVAMGDLDADPFTLNTPAGLVDLRTGRIDPPDPSTLCTKMTPVAPSAEPDPIWQRFLDETFGDDHELATYVQRLVGVTLLGTVREQLLAFLHGIGANGKSTIAETLMHTLGVGDAGYAVAAPAEMLMIRKHSEHPAELAQLAGARMVVCSELDEGQRFAEAKIKQLTGRDSINARFLYGQPFTFRPTHTLWLLGNHRPQAATGGHAFWRRVKLLEFRNIVPKESQIADLGERLEAAGGTVLAWAIAGAVDYLGTGMREPVVVKAATESYAADQDTVNRFVTDGASRADSEMVRCRVSAFRTAYEGWCRDVGEDPVSAKRLTQELRERFGVGEIKSNGSRFYTRICLLENDDDEGRRWHD